MMENESVNGEDDGPVADVLTEKASSAFSSRLDGEFEEYSGHGSESKIVVPR